VLTKDLIVKGIHHDKESSGKDLVSSECASAIFDVLASEGVLQDDYSLDLNVPKDHIKSMLDSKLPSSCREEYDENQGSILNAIMRSRYVNLYSLLRDHLSEKTYVAIVSNQILVDVQGEDLLFQIFTSGIVKRKSSDESPFLEFIQRVCSECIGADGCPKGIKSGCGGFGVRNFLTLFLSIEVTKAMIEVSSAKERGDKVRYDFSQRRVELFTDQLNESNPILTEISDAMTREGIAKENIVALQLEGKEEEAESWKLVMDKEGQAKAVANEKLMKCNMKYQRLMKGIRESQE
jgi:hypothetical protein